MKLKISLAMAFALLSSGCANVEVRDRNYLAQPHMAAEPDPLMEKFLEHAYFSREGTHGGNGVGGGGCGCN